MPEKKVRLIESALYHRGDLVYALNVDGDGWVVPVVDLSPSAIVERAKRGEDAVPDVLNKPYPAASAVHSPPSTKYTLRGTFSAEGRAIPLEEDIRALNDADAWKIAREKQKYYHSLEGYRVHLSVFDCSGQFVRNPIPAEKKS